METTIRPWGYYTVLHDSQYTKVKELTVGAGKSLSYQYHTQRQEHWVIVKGIATITIDDCTREYTYNEHITIPLGVKHKLSNNTNDELIIIEIQTGTYFGEDDIIRLDEDFSKILEAHN
jgi:mannose-6-phosphate isomerase